MEVECVAHPKRDRVTPSFTIFPLTNGAAMQPACAALDPPHRRSEQLQRASRGASGACTAGQRLEDTSRHVLAKWVTSWRTTQAQPGVPAPKRSVVRPHLQLARRVRSIQSAPLIWAATAAATESDEFHCSFSLHLLVCIVSQEMHSILESLLHIAVTWLLNSSPSSIF